MFNYYLSEISFCLLFPTLDHISLQSIGWSLENHGLQEPVFSSLKVLPPEDQQAQTPPAPEGKRLEGDLEVLPFSYIIYLANCFVSLN